jgi:hypothetical protein
MPLDIRIMFCGHWSQSGPVPPPPGHTAAAKYKATAVARWNDGGISKQQVSAALIAAGIALDAVLRVLHSVGICC